MRIDKFSLVSMEMIDYQLKDPVLDKILDIIRKNKNKEIDYEISLRKDLDLPLR